MESERRGTERQASFTTAELIASTPSVGNTSYGVMMGDRSDRGFGVVFVGQEVLDPKLPLTLLEGDGTRHPVRVVWTRQVAKYICLIGLEVVT